MTFKSQSLTFGTSTRMSGRRGRVERRGMQLEGPVFRNSVSRSRSRKRRALGIAQSRRLPFRKHLGKESKYVDGFLDIVDIEKFSKTATDTWASTEKNPKQTSAIYGCLPVPRQGVNYADRDGRKILQKNIFIRGTILWQSVDSSTAPLEHRQVRLVVVQDTRTNGIALSGENVIGPGLGSNGSSTTCGNSGAINLPSNPDGWGRYKIKLDRTYRCPPLPSWGNDTEKGNGSSMVTPFKFVIRCNCVINFNSSTGAVGSIIDNSFHFLVGCTDMTATPKIMYYARTSFEG